MFFGILRMIRK